LFVLFQYAFGAVNGGDVRAFAHVVVGDFQLVLAEQILDEQHAEARVFGIFALREATHQFVKVIEGLL